MTNLESLAPANGSTVNTQTPTVVATTYIDESDPVIVFRVRVSTNPDPTISPLYDNSRTVEFGYSGYFYHQNEYWTLPPLALGTYYVRCDATYQGGSTISGSPKVNSFTVSFVPTATAISPASGSWFTWSDGASPYPLVVNWSYSGAGNQSAYQVVVERNSDGLVVADSGKIASSNKQATINIPITYKDVLLRWKVRAWDSADNPSIYTSTRTFTAATPPTAAITSPTADQVMTTGTPSVTFTIGTSGGRSATKWTASLWTGLTKVWEKTVTGNASNGASVTVADTSVFLSQNTPYTYRVTVTDSQNLVSTEVTRNFTIDYVDPNAPGTLSVSDALYDVSGYVEISWANTGVDAAFYSWEVEREDSLINPDTGAVLSVGDWKKVGALYVTASPNIFRDYHAPSNYQVRYRVRQVAFKFNTEVPSSYTTSDYVIPSTESYWLISGTNGTSSAMIVHQFHNVIADDFEEEHESNEFILMGRGRYSERGTDLGVRGSLSIQLRNTAGTTARQKRLALNAFKEAIPTATLRNPFGDEYYVSVGNIGVTRLAGTGKSEFCDVTIPYSEVVNQ